MPEKPTKQRAFKQIQPENADSSSDDFSSLGDSSNVTWQATDELFFNLLFVVVTRGEMLLSTFEGFHWRDIILSMLISKSL